MSNRRNAAKVDENAAMIVKALRSIGATVQPIIGTGKSGTPDLLCGYRRQTFLLEIKKTLTTPKGKPIKRPLRACQEVWHREWQGLPVATVSSVPEAFTAIGALTKPEYESEALRRQRVEEFLEPKPSPIRGRHKKKVSRAEMTKMFGPPPEGAEWVQISEGRVGYHPKKKASK